MYYPCMTNVQIRNVPDEIHKALVRRAAVAGQSLQQYLTAQLTELATKPTMDEVITRSESGPLGSLSSANAIDALDVDRARR